MTGDPHKPMPHRRTVASLLFGAVAALVPCRAAAQWTAFLPSPYENHAFFETYASFERDSSNGGHSEVDWTDTFLRERFTLQSLGYSYDPRFVQYQLSLSGAATQERYDSAALDSGRWKAAGAFEYDARLYFLPDHPYNFRVFASRHQPVFREKASSGHDTVADTYSALARYRHKPYFFNASFLDSSHDSSGSSSNVKRLGFDGEYFKRFHNGYEVSVNGAINPSWYVDSRGLDGSSNEYLLGNFVNLKRLRLNSSLTQNSFEQSREPSQNYDTDQFQWWERLSVYLPWNFRTNVAYRYHDDNSTVATGVQPEREYSDNGNNVQFDLIHRLYDSLDSTYRLTHDARTSSGGRTALLSHGLSFDYNKRIPRGRFATGLSLGRVHTDNSGFADIVNDPYTATAVPSTFALRQQNIDPETIEVFLKSPLPPYEMIRLDEGVHYHKNTSVEPFEIQIFGLPPDFVIPGTYDLYLNFSLRGGEFELQSDSLGNSVTLQLFDDLLTPFFRYLAIRSDVLSGQSPGIAVDSDAYTAGLLAHYGPLRARGEFHYLDWEANPQRSWRTELQYVATLWRSTSAYAVASYVNRHYLGGQGLYYTDEYTEETVTTAATVTQTLPFRDMYLSLGGSYSNIRGLVESNAWSVNSSFVWRIGKLDVSVGLSAYGADTASRQGPATDRNRELLFVSLRRQLM